MSQLEVFDLGTVPFRVADQWQRTLHRQRVDREIPDLLLLLEHPHVYTVGRRFEQSHLKLSSRELFERGMEICEVDRGGSITYHGPGQLVCYPILDLRESGREFPDVVAYVRMLERAIIQSLDRFDITATTVQGRTGVWVDDSKIAAIGVNISRGVSKHGLAVNVDPDLSFFDGMIPCGISDAAVTSITKVTGRAVGVKEMLGPLCEAIASVFGREVATGPPSRLPPAIFSPSLSLA